MVHIYVHICVCIYAYVCATYFLWEDIKYTQEFAFSFFYIKASFGRVEFRLPLILLSFLQHLEQPNFLEQEGRRLIIST